MRPRAAPECAKFGQPCQISAMMLTMLPPLSAIQRLQASRKIAPGLTPPPQAFRLSLRPRASTFLAAFRSRSWTVPHAWQVQARTASGLGPSLTPHAEQTCDVGSNRPTFANRRPYLAALYGSVVTNADQPAS